ncbi:MAG: tRNA (adenosine(37)-N6)-threonylcarbamoyltransferase complex dimerization subunit type 1 TsaB [Bacteroidia bacterium]|nr:tRNA (adenosine(37)-N6)-threonylcarbamoyltransferase complex dimerization subunit type 1 TsaB [Bacteroidia bacterium]
MATLLLIETADEVCSVGISVDGKIVALEEVIEKNAHSRLINKLIESLITKTDYSFADLDAVAVSKGPGSYTGLRIGTATAKAMCFALNIPLISVNTLYSLAANYSATTESEFYMPMLDARRMEVYTAQFDKSLNEVKPTTALVLTEESILDWTQNKKVILFGNGALKCKGLVERLDNVQVIENVYPSVKGMVSAATKRYQHKDFEDLAYFEPFYLKDFVTTTPKKNLI